jgi:hypothetical protein
VWLGAAGRALSALSETPDLVLNGVDVYGRFGTACVVLDFNQGWKFCDLFIHLSGSYA